MAQKRKYELPDLDLSGGLRLTDDAIVESWSKTEQYKVRGRHFWTIMDFMRRASSTEIGNSLCSPVFSVPVESPDGEQNLTFQLEVFPNGEEGEDNSDYVAVFLTSRKLEELEVKYDFSVQKADGSSWGRIGNTFKKFSPEQNSWGYGKAFSKQKLGEKASELMPGGKLTIICNLEIYYYDRHTQGKKQKLDFKLDDTPTLGENMATAFGREDWVDVTLSCEGREFRCHKIILASRSDVFAAMFSHPNTEEGRTNKVKIEDVDADTLSALLQFVYSDKIEEDIGSLASSLLTAADKYNIPRLKLIAEQAIAQNVEVNNAAESLILAYLHEAKCLKTVALDFVCNNMKKVSETPGWQVISQSHPKIMSEILVIMTTKVRS